LNETHCGPFKQNMTLLDNVSQPKITPRLVFLLQTTIFSIISKKQSLSTKALQNWKIFVKALSKQLWKLMIKMKQLITIIIANFKAY